VSTHTTQVVCRSCVSCVVRPWFCDVRVCACVRLHCYAPYYLIRILGSLGLGPCVADDDVAATLGVSTMYHHSDGEAAGPLRDQDPGKPGETRI